MEQIYLQKNWQLRYEKMRTKISEAPVISAKKEGWFDVSVPCDVHEPLIAQGIIQDPSVGLNCFGSEWIQEKSWWFQKQFVLEESFLQHQVIELYIETLDFGADIVVNDVFIERHNSAFYAFRKNIKQYLKAGENTILIRVTVGLEYASEDEMMVVETPMFLSRKRDDPRRIMLRKPQFCFGWDWCPKVPSCGILSSVILCGMDEIAIRSAYLSTVSISPQAVASCHVEIQDLDQLYTKDASLHITVFDGDTVVVDVTKNLLLKSGLNYIDEMVTIENPKLWWPNGAGEPNLYKVNIWTECNGAVCRYQTFQFGIRTFEVLQEVIGDQSREFAFTVNGKKLYSKGANWVPADSVPNRITKKKYRTLVEEARNANFNTLRVWGGGLYEKEFFYQYCDENGIMVWQDFAFACAMYPDVRSDFVAEVEKEMDFQTRRLRSHPSLVMWCGNNEMHWGYDTGYSPENRPTVFGGQICYNQLAPRIVYQNSPHVFYWNGSPYGGHNAVNSNEMGDAHIWFDCTFHKTDMDKRITPEVYDTDIHSNFVSEYGFIGACCKETTIKYYGSEDIDTNSDIWKLHINNQDLDNGNTELLRCAIEKHYRDVEGLGWEEYIKYTALCQGMMYEYSLEALRVKPHNYGGLFWMYNDCWGEIGWTIIDYYLKRKASFYFVKRAFAPINFILRKKGDKVYVTGVNDTPNQTTVTLKCGYFSFGGETKDLHTVEVELKPFFKGEVHSFKWVENDVTKGSYCAVPVSHPTVSTAILRQATYRECEFVAADITVSGFEQKNRTARFDISANKFAHAVHFNLPEDIHCSDEYFDLLPGQVKTIELYNVPYDLTPEQIVPVSVATKH